MRAGRAIAAGRSRRPTTAFLLSVVGGVATAAWAAFEFSIALAAVRLCNPPKPGYSCGYTALWNFAPYPFLLASIVGLVAGATMAVVALAAYARPRLRQPGGDAIVALAIVGMTAYAGFGVGLVLGVLGGLLFRRFRRTPGPAPAEWSGSYPAGVPPPRGGPPRPVTDRPGVTPWPGASRPAAPSPVAGAPVAAAATTSRTVPQSPEGAAPAGGRPRPVPVPSAPASFPRRMPPPRLPPSPPESPSLSPPPAAPAAAPPAPKPNATLRPVGPAVGGSPPSPVRTLAQSPPSMPPRAAPSAPAPAPLRPFAPPRATPEGSKPPVAVPAPPSASLPRPGAETPSPAPAARPPPPAGPLPPKRARVWKCPGCGLVNAPWSNHCTKCGTAAPSVEGGSA